MLSSLELMVLDDLVAYQAKGNTLSFGQVAASRLLEHAKNCPDCLGTYSPCQIALPMVGTVEIAGASLFSR